jgi:hypothetical protein
MIGIWLFCLSGCAMQSGTPTACEDSLKAFQDGCTPRMEELGAQIRKETGNPGCTASEQCRTAAIGAKICGGPAAYVPYSIVDTDEQRFLSDVNEFNKLSALHARLRSVELGVTSDCVLVTDPGAACVSNVCTLR